MNEQWEFEKQTTECKRQHKAMLVDNYHNSIMEVRQLAVCMKEISTFLNRKLDVLGMDLCMGAMFEIIFEFSDYVHYYVGSQNCELKDGWDYETISKNLNDQIDSRDFAKNIVKAYKSYYEVNALMGVYTQSALDLELVDEIKKDLDNISQEIMSLSKYDSCIKSLLSSARNESLSFCMHSDYVDLVDFLERIKFKFQSSFKDNYLQIINLIETAICNIKKIIIQNIKGKKIAQANGICIYAPQEYLDESYLQCTFAQNSLWTQFINLLLQNF